jgi:hypothetical protein
MKFALKGVSARLPGRSGAFGFHSRSASLADRPCGLVAPNMDLVHGRARSRQARLARRAARGGGLCRSWMGAARAGQAIG